MRLWVRKEDAPSAAFLIPKKTPNNSQLVGFHLSLTMVYINIATSFYATAYTVTNMENTAINYRYYAHPHLLETISDTR